MDVSAKSRGHEARGVSTTTGMQEVEKRRSNCRGCGVLSDEFGVMAVMGAKHVS